MLHIAYVIKKGSLPKNPMVFHNESKHDFHFIIKDLTEKLIATYLTYLVSVRNDVKRVDKNGEKLEKLQFTDLTY